jgi:hypothetical protein
MGIIRSLIREARPAKAQYDPARDVPDLSGKIIIVTGTKVNSFGSSLVYDPPCCVGGNTGIGYEIVKVRVCCAVIYICPELTLPR